MNYFEDTWHVIDTYFNSNPYFLTKHHLESWNDFVSNKITGTIKVLNPYVILKNQENGKIQHEINIFVGGIEGEDIFLNKPTIYENGEQRVMYPNEARIRDLTYQTEIYSNIVVRYITREGEDNVKVEEKVFNNVKIGAFPIMLHSKLCCLYEQPFEVLREMGECPYDQGGYFIVDGKEKVIVAQERIALNKLFINKSKDDIFSHEALVRCISEDNPLFPKTIHIYVAQDKSKYNYTRKTRQGRLPNSITITCPNISKDIPIFIIFRALGIESDKEILEYIVYDIDNPKSAALLEFLRYSVLDANKVMTQLEALEYLKSYVEYNNIDKVKHVLVNDLFPNVGNEFRNKVMFLGHLLNKLVRTVLGIINESDRDNYIYKRVDISGFLVGNLFRDYYNQFRNSVRSSVDKQYLFGPWKTTKDISNLINKTNIASIFKSSIIEDGFRKSLKGSWGKSMVEEIQDSDSVKQGIVQDLSRISYMGFMSHIRRVNTPMDPTSKIVAPHRLHPSQWGIMCPIESPDGASVGLLKHFAILCHVTFESGAKIIGECLKDTKLVTFTEHVSLIDTSIATKVSINSNWIGITFEPEKLFKLMRLFKKNGFIDKYVSISWDIVGMEINISTEAGRCVRPVYVVEDGSLLISKVIKRTDMTWTMFTEGSLKNTKNTYTDPFKFLGIGHDYDKVIEALGKTQAVIEYLDVEETNGSMIAMDGNSVTDRHTHCEIHPSVMLGAVSQNIPLCNHNQAPRNIFFGSQSKQAVGTPLTSFNNRIDTMLYVLHYPQKQLVTTRYKEYLNNNVLTGGENLIVAISTWTGYNQEDSIIINKASMERGMFNMTYFKNMVHKEEDNPNENERIIFKNPLKLINDGHEVSNVKFARYTKTLDDDGYPKPNVYVYENDAIIGKTLVKTILADEGVENLFGNKVKKEVYSDKSVVADKNISGIIDKVYVYRDTDNNKTCKLRFRKVKQPELGDKMACYSEDTEVLTNDGWVYFKDMTKEHNVATLVGQKLVYQKPIELQNYDHDGQMYEVDSNQIKLLVTGNHRMYVRNRYSGYDMVQADSIVNSTRYYKKNVDVWEPDMKDVPVELEVVDGKVTHFKIPGVSISGVEHEPCKFDIDSWLAFFGIWLAEGCATYNIGYGVRFAANKERVKVALTECSKNMNLNIVKVKSDKEDEPSSWRMNNNIPLSSYIQSITTSAPHKSLPKWVWFLNREQCQKLINGMCLGDGHTMINGTVRYDTSSTQLADDFQRLCLHAGWSSNKILKYPAGHEAVKKDGYVIKSKYDAYRLTINTSQNEPIVNKHRKDGHKFDKWVDYKGKVYCCTVPEGKGVLYVRRQGYTVWCGNSSHGQKGVVGLVLSPENMPFNKDGIVPDIIVNPHAFPSRMTIGHLLECVLSKTCLNEGMMVDATPFNNHEYKDIYEELEKKFGLDKYGNEIMYNGRNGEQIETEIFFGPTYYQRLKHMVSDKINYRTTGAMTATTRQPTQGRGNNGGLRIGEMERDTILSHGINAFLKESMMERSDKYSFDIEKSTGDIAITSRNGKKKGFKPIDDDNRFFDTVQTPYAFKLLVQEMKTMSVKPILCTDDIDEEDNYDDVEVDVVDEDEE